MSTRPARLLGLTAAVALALVAGPVPASGGSTLPGGATAARSGSGPGKAGPVLTLQSGVQVQGYDVGVTSDGTTYIGWISSAGSAADRTVHLCVIEPGTSACAGGVRSAASLGGSSAADLHVLTTPEDAVELVWFHDTDQSINGPYEAKLAMATVQPDHSIGPVTDVASAPSFGQLFDADLAPGGDLYAVTGRTVVTSDDTHTELRIQPGIGASPVTLQAPVMISKARLGLGPSGGLLVIDQYGAVAKPLRVSYQLSDGSSAAFTAVHGTWSVGGAFDVAPARGAVRLVAAIDDASYYPRIAAWKGADFGPFALTGDKSSCAATSHDLFPDMSGRLADTSAECGKVRVANQPQAGRAATVRFSTGNTPSGPDPQIGTTPRGTGWVVWGQEDSTANALLAAPVRLPALATSRRESNPSGRVTVRGPVSCMPASDLKVGVGAKPARGWSLVSRQLLLDGSSQGAVLGGADLAPGSSHALTGKATFKRGAERRTVTATLTFAACSGPSAF